MMLNAQLRKMTMVMGALLLVFASNYIFAQHKTMPKMGKANEEIVFEHGPWKEVLAMAKKEGKYIFVDAYATWCAPCKLLKSTTFKDKITAAYFNKNFINYTADMEKGEGIELAERWDITSYPTLLFFKPDGKMVLKQVGYVDGKQLKAVGEQAIAKP